ncbi:Cullin-1 [Galdieria sulphuraria]|nr:Cullin-1 [Galdieria sulphuraria]
MRANKRTEKSSFEELRKATTSCLRDGNHFVQTENLTKYHSLVYALCCDPDRPRAEELYKWLKKTFLEYTKEIFQEFTNSESYIAYKCLRKQRKESYPGEQSTEKYTESKENLSYVSTLLELENDNFVQLRKYTVLWESFCAGLQAATFIFSYLERSWITERKKGGILETRGVYDIYTLGVLTWKDHLFRHLREWIVRNTLSLLRMGTVEAIVQEEDSEEEDLALSIYRNKFEKPFLEETSRYYHKLGTELKASYSEKDFLRQVEICLNEEQRLSEQFCHSSSMALLRNRCEDALIVKHLDIFYSLSDMYLRDSQEEELRLVYRLLSRVPGALKPVQDSLKTILIDWGSESLGPFKERTESNMMPTSPLLSGKQDNGKDCKEHMSSLEKSMMEYDAFAEQEAESFVNAAWNIYIHSRKLVEEAFMNDEGFILALEQGCNKFFNSVSCAPHLLARFCHKMLERPESDLDFTEEERENRLVKVTRLFRLLEEKDLFQRLYSVKLARRLIYGTSASTDAEEAMLARLRETCGQDYVSQLQRMFTDCQTSREEVISFRSSPYGGIPLGFEFSVMVLTAGSWPIDPSTSKNSCKEYSMSYSDIHSLPSMFSKAVEAFSEYYSEKFEGRRLMWLHSLSKVDLRANLWSHKPSSKSWCELQVSFPQALILLKYNDRITSTFSELHDATGLETEEVKLSLKILIGCGILRVSSNDYELIADSSQSNRIDDIIVSLNDEFSPRKRKMKLANLLEPEMNKESSDVENSRRKMEEDRRLQIQACLVRIMKRYRRANLSFLIGETVSLLSHRFKAAVSDIKLNLESLVEKDYIVKVDDAADTFEYVA